MKKITLNGVFALTAGILAAFIALGTAAVFAAGPRPARAADSGIQADAASGNDASSSESARMWTGLGRLRCPLKPLKGTTTAPTVVVTIAFSYNRADSAFTYELARNNARFRGETLKFFAALDIASPLLNDESILKQKLLERFNAPLRLGKISALFFSEYILID
ncbi:MAG: hypothetical protein LBG74_07220 [Spirochaetaceae bacterium]|nr:hypothetical protein [Spirochaetaceae bacterium]